MSSLNLEPNPFEQSFAHTGKLNQTGSTASSTSGTNINNNLETINGSKFITNTINSSQFTHQSQVSGKTGLYTTLQSPLPLLEKQSTLSISQLTSDNRVLSDDNNTNNISSTTHIIPSISTNDNDSSNDPLNSNTFTMNRPTIFGPTLSSAFIFPPVRPNIQTPGVLTPGGSKKLPPPILSPNFLPSNTDDSITNITNTNSNNNNNVNVTSNTNSYFSYIPKTGSTPNEANIRTGLTPGSSYPLFQNIGFNNNNNSLNSSNTNIVSTTNIPNNYNSSMTPDIPNGNSISTLNNNIINDYTKMPNTRYSLSPSPSVFGMSMSLTTGINTTVPLTGVTVLNNSNSVSEDKNIGNSLVTEQTDNNNDTCVNIDDSNNNHNNRRRKSAIYDVSKEIDNSKLSEKATTKSRRRKYSLNIDEHQDSTEPTSKNVKSTKNERKHRSSENDKTSQEYLDEKERKRREFLERNRIAASKFRKRKKEYIQRIENDFRHLQIEYDEMRSVLDALCSFNTHKHKASILSRLRFNLERNYVTEAMNDLNEIEYLVQNIEYYKRGGISVLASEKKTTSIPISNSKNSSVKQSFRPVNPSTLLPTDSNDENNNRIIKN